MKIKNIEYKLDLLKNQYDNPKWIKDSGIEKLALENEIFEFTKKCNASVIEIKAKTFELIANKAQIAVEPEDIFQACFNAEDIMRKQRDEIFVKDFYKNREDLPDEILRKKATELFVFDVAHDVSHLSSNTDLLLKIGVNGVLNNIKNARRNCKNPTPSTDVFYNSCESVFNSFKTLINRLSKVVEQQNHDLYTCLTNLKDGAPSNVYEALQLLLLYFYTHEYLMSSRIRTLGRLDKILYSFYKNDIENGVFTKLEIKEMLKYFLTKLSAMNVPFNLPFAIGGGDSLGNEITNELSYLIVEAYTELDIYSPKIHVCMSKNTPMDFILKILSSIKSEKNSFVFANDEVVVNALKKVGVEEADARNYVLIGCYEPAVYVDEIGCTGNGGINAMKMIEYVFTRGYDYLSGVKMGIDTGKINSYDEFILAVKAQLKYAVDCAIKIINGIEKDYPKFYADPMLSGMIDNCLKTGLDAYTGSAKYNNSSLFIRFFASFVDAISAVKKIVFLDKDLTFTDLFEVLKNDWNGYENLRAKVLSMKERFGNNNPVADEIAVEFSHYFANIVNNRANGRGGVFKASNFTIDRYVEFGKHTMASPDGRKSGEPLSKNLCPVTGMDKNGVTAVINSVAKLDFTDYPNGAVLDVVLHPSAVSGDDGLQAMYALLLTYFKKGGMTLHGNVLDAEVLKKAQLEPKKYANLQIRVCGWNAYFVNLTPEEQEDLIKKSSI